jgi:hypothetical protein
MRDLPAVEPSGHNPSTAAESDGKGAVRATRPDVSDDVEEERSRACSSQGCVLAIGTRRRVPLQAPVQSLVPHGCSDFFAMSC